MGSVRSRRFITFAILSLVVVTMLVLNTGMGAVTIPPAVVVSLLAERVGLEVEGGLRPVSRSRCSGRSGFPASSSGCWPRAPWRRQVWGCRPCSATRWPSRRWSVLLGERRWGLRRRWQPEARHPAAFAPAAGASVTALLATLLAYRIARRGPRVEVVTLILAGVAINAIAAAAVGLLVNVAERGRMRSFSFWSLGSLGGATWHTVSVTLVFVLPGIALLALRSRQLNVLLLGDEQARHSGLDVRRLRVEVVVAASLLTGASVAAAGVIGFVGLLAPHTVRMITGPDNRTLLPGAMLLGAVLLLGADLASRTAVAPAEIPLGVLTSLVGGPFFLWLLHRTRRAQGGWG